MKLNYKIILKNRDVSGFDLSQYPPFHELDYTDRERLVLSMVNKFMQDRRSFAVSRSVKVAKEAKTGKTKVAKLTKESLPLEKALSSLTDEQLKMLLTKLGEKKNVHTVQD